MKKFKIGDRVKFIKQHIRDQVSPYNIHDEELRGMMFTNGTTLLPKDYVAIVTATTKSFYVVSYTDTTGSKLALGFREEYLELLKPRLDDALTTAIKERYGKEI